MEKTFKKTKLIKTVIICIIVLMVILAILYFYNKKNSVLFKSSFTNFAWEPISDGYIIYSNGIIKEYDDYNKNKELKSAKISNEELERLKELANKVEDNYKEDDSIKMRDFGVHTSKIYSKRLKKWIKLSSFGDMNGNNKTEESQEILNLTQEIYDKYLKK